MTQKKQLGFSLAEIVIALGICSFVLVALVGLFSIGLKASRDSINQFQAADLASQIIATRSASPTKEIAGLSGTLALPATAMTQAYGNAYGTATNYVGHDGKLTTLGKAAYQIICSSGTTAKTGPHVAEVYFVLSWPPQATPANAEGKYETITYIPLH